MIYTLVILDIHRLSREKEIYIRKRREKKETQPKEIVNLYNLSQLFRTSILGHFLTGPLLVDK